MKKDYLIVGSGLYGAVFSHEMKKTGYTCLVIDKRSHLAANTFTESVEEIQVHKNGAHIFHTDNKIVWDYMNQFTSFNSYINSPVTNYKGELYSLPFNMNRFDQLWKITSPEEALEKIELQKLKLDREPQNLEEHYFDMDDVIESAIQDVQIELERRNLNV